MDVAKNIIRLVNNLRQEAIGKKQKTTKSNFTHASQALIVYDF
jgi:hypothetical protein